MKKIGLSSFPVAAYALALGHHIQGTTRSGRRVTFIFHDSPELREHLRDYEYGNPNVPVRDYESSQARLKALIYDRPWEEARC